MPLLSSIDVPTATRAPWGALQLCSYLGDQAFPKEQGLSTSFPFHIRHQEAQRPGVARHRALKGPCPPLRSGSAVPGSSLIPPFMGHIGTDVSCFIPALPAVVLYRPAYMASPKTAPPKTRARVGELWQTTPPPAGAQAPSSILSLANPGTQ